jgi:hypothetical protein
MLSVNQILPWNKSMRRMNPLILKLTACPAKNITQHHLENYKGVILYLAQ